MRVFFLPACLCLLVAVHGVTSFAAGNGVERSPWIWWDSSALKAQPDVRAAIETSIEEECPQLVELFQSGNRLRVVDSRTVQAPAGALSESVLELTFKVDSSPDNEFKVKVAMDKVAMDRENDSVPEPNTRFGAIQTEPREMSEKMTAKVIEWIGVESCLGDELDLPNPH